MVTRGYTAGRALDRIPRPLRLIALVVVVGFALLVVFLLLADGKTSPRPAAAVLTPTASTTAGGQVPVILPSRSMPDPFPEWRLTASTLAAVPLDAAVANARTSRPEVALTFDDGPSIYTAAVLRTLRSGHATATFFLIGRQVPGREELLRKMVSGGDEIGDHTWAHAPLPALSRSDAKSQVDGAAQVIAAAVGSPPTVFRPPYGAMKPSTNKLVRDLHMLPVVWSVDPHDYVHPVTARHIARAVLTHIKAGSIVLMHDGGGDRTATVAALRQILAGLAAMHLKAVTVTQLLNDAQPGTAGLVWKE
jgi:peptidoglycan-N-acetylglucosamine deacetylase